MFLNEASVDQEILTNSSTFSTLCYAGPQGLDITRVKTVTTKEAICYVLNMTITDALLTGIQLL
jgi:hypothetical protein